MLGLLLGLGEEKNMEKILNFEAYL